MTLVVARGLALHTRAAKVFGPVDLDLEAGAAHLVAGAAGSGRTSLLLALSGRMRGVTGSLHVDGIDALDQPRAVRRRSSVARADGLVDLEDSLTVQDCLQERALADGVPSRRAIDRFHEIEELLGVDVDVDLDLGMLSSGLPAEQRTLLSLTLALLRPAPLVVLDDLDRGLAPGSLTRVLDRVAGLTRHPSHGTTVVASVLSAPPAWPHPVTVLSPPYDHRSRIA